MDFNYKAFLAAALANFVIGFLWYNPKTLGNIWMKESGITPESAKNSNMVRLFATSIIGALFLSLAIHPMVLHQWGFGSLIANALESSDAAVKATAEADLAAIMGKYGNEFRTFKHGALHGFMNGFLVVATTIAVNAGYEGKSWKYVMINAGYWMLSMTIMGGIISAWQ